jgi:hypothetical protein
VIPNETWACAAGAMPQSSASAAAIGIHLFNKAFTKHLTGWDAELAVELVYA